MEATLVNILVPALIAKVGDLRSLLKTVAEAPSGIGARVVPIIQFGPDIENTPDQINLELAHRCPAPIQAVFIGEAAGKWGALRQGLARCADSPWSAVVDGDAAYDLSALPRALQRAQEVQSDLLMGERREILVDPSEHGRARSHLEPVVNELLRTRLESGQVRLSDLMNDLQSGFLLVRTALLEEFLARERMDGAEGDEADGLPPLPWTYYGGELHLHAYVAEQGWIAAPYPVFVRYGRSSGLTVEVLGEMLGASRYFQDVTIDEIEAQVVAAATKLHWSDEEKALARWAAAVAFRLDP